MPDQERRHHPRCPFAMWMRILKPPPLGTLPLHSRIGLLLLVANIPFGYLMLLAGTAIATFTAESRWLLIGTAGYALSWLMLGLGVLMAGPALTIRLKRTVKRRKKAWKRLRASQKNA